MFAYIEVVPFDFTLGVLYSFANNSILDWYVFRQPESVHSICNLISAKNTHDIILQTYVKTGRTRVSLPTGAASQLIIDSAGFVSFGPDYMKTSKLNNTFS